MRVVRVLAVLNAILAVVSSLLAAAPFTPAIVLFVFYAPLACVFAALNQRTPALLVVVASALAWVLSPMRYQSPLPAQLGWLAAWIACWSILTTLLSISKVRTALLNILGIGTSGA